MPTQTLPSGASVSAATNLAQLNGTTIDTNSGNKSAGTERVVIATDQPQLTNAFKVDPSAVTSPISNANLDSPLSTKASAANQATEIANLAGIKTDTDSLLNSVAGGFVRQDSTISIAKEFGGNLDDINAAVTSSLSDLDIIASLALASSSGIYIRQDSTDSIATEETLVQVLETLKSSVDLLFILAQNAMNANLTEGNP